MTTHYGCPYSLGAVDSLRAADAPSVVPVELLCQSSEDPLRDQPSEVHRSGVTVILRRGAFDTTLTSGTATSTSFDLESR
jgi:hypothetical protein